MTDDEHKEVLRLLKERGVEIRAEAVGGDGAFPADLCVTVKIDGETVFERDIDSWILGEPEEGLEMRRDQSEIIGVHENTDWFRYVPNEPICAEGCDVQAKWVNGSRIFRHRRKGSGAWRDGAPWDK